MPRTPQPRFVTDIRLVVEISALDADDAEKRLAAVQDFIEEKLGRSTFKRLPGKPSVDHYPDVISDVVPV